MGKIYSIDKTQLELWEAGESPECKVANNTFILDERNVDTRVFNLVDLVDDYYERVEASADGYQVNSRHFAVHEIKDDIEYHILGLTNEAGEVAGVMKKFKRGDMGEDTPTSREATCALREALVDELGDVLWYAARVADWCEMSIEDIMDRNIEKLVDRKKRDVIKGSGDYR